ncbi:hypothetical protein OVA29_04465 [Exiguobacterium sp. SL14]|nr:hypothetical protein [Exiguobacterium sp. SL14]MCY1690158.1 hypothetical protein [Exiguobacterium sp. SL14]
MRPTLPIVYLLISYGLMVLASGTPFVPPVAVLSTLLGVTFVAVKVRHWFFPKHSERSVGIAILLFASGLWINFILTFIPHSPEVDSAANLTLTAFLALTAIAFARLIDWSSIRHARLLYIDGVLLFGMVFVFGYTVILRHLPTFARSDIEFVAMLGYSISFIAQLFFFLILYATGLRGPTHKRLIRAMMLFIVANLGYYTFFIRNELTFAACFFPLYAVSLHELAVYFRDVPPKQPARDRLGRPYLPYISLLVLLARCDVLTNRAGCLLPDADCLILVVYVSAVFLRTAQSKITNGTRDVRSRPNTPDRSSYRTTRTPEGRVPTPVSRSPTTNYSTGWQWA